MHIPENIEGFPLILSKVFVFRTVSSVRMRGVND
jgi:hypothetical protein